MAAGACVLTTCVHAQDKDKPKDAKPEDTKIVLNGLLDTYFQYSFNHPPSGTALSGRSFDVRQNEFSVSLAELNISKAPSAVNPVGFKATLTLGKTADLVHATEPGTANTYKYLQQVYGTYMTRGSRPITIDFGKFVTHTGMEVIESSANDNYSRSLLFNYAIPFYHAGIRASVPLTSTLTGMLMVVNGWNNVEDDNGGKSIGAQLAWAPNAKWSWYLNYLGGDESTGAALPANLNVQLVDLVGTWNLTSKLKLGLNLDYASAGKKGTPGGTWSGEAIYGRYQFSASSALALRGEHFEDTGGLRTGTSQNLNEITATLEKAVNDHLLLRFEFRHDHAGSKFFPSGGGASSDQDTITFAPVVKF
jgi:hypothetical protein